MPTADGHRTEVAIIGDADVLEAGRRWDRDTPSTHRELVRARLAAQERAGIAPENRAPLYSGEVESYLPRLWMNRLRWS